MKRSVVLAFACCVLIAACGDDEPIGAPDGDGTSGPTDEAPTTTGPPPTTDPAETTIPPTATPVDVGSTVPEQTVPDPDENRPAPTPATSRPTNPLVPEPTLGPPPSTDTPPTRPTAAGTSLTDLAVADLADRLGVDPASITVMLSEDVTWRNGSLGCPEPGMSYTQALVDGFRIVLEAEGREYAYHSGRGAPPFLCARPAEDATTPGGV